MVILGVTLFKQVGDTLERRMRDTHTSAIVQTFKGRTKRCLVVPLYKVLVLLLSARCVKLCVRARTVILLLLYFEIFLGRFCEEMMDMLRRKKTRALMKSSCATTFVFKIWTNLYVQYISGAAFVAL